MLKKLLTQTIKRSITTNSKTQSQKSSQTITKTLEKSPYFQVDHAPYTTELQIHDTQQNPKYSVFRCLNLDGTPVDPDFQLPMSENEAIKMYETMVLQRRFDDVFYKLARMNLISFYMQNVGEEACAVASIAAMNMEDIIFSQYREMGAFLYRGLSIQQCADVCFSNNRDYNCGRQMPVHYGSTKLNMVTISSTLATQMPQAAGAAYAVKRKPNNNNCVLCYFGEGAASEGDAMVAFNLSATTSSPILWFCRNNAYAISTPVEDQYRGDGILGRAAGYGMYACRFDGNDIFATYMATRACRDVAISQQRPVFLEALTYRGAHHSTSDDSKTYRSENEENDWQTIYNPIVRTRNFLEYKGLWNMNKDMELLEKVESEVDKAREKSEQCLKPHWKHLYTDVYKDMPKRIKEQMDYMDEHLKKYGNEDHYRMHQHTTDIIRDGAPDRMLS